MYIKGEKMLSHTLGFDLKMILGMNSPVKRTMIVAMIVWIIIMMKSDAVMYCWMMLVSRFAIWIL
jgi:hypothetical protein